METKSKQDGIYILMKEEDELYMAQQNRHEGNSDKTVRVMPCHNCLAFLSCQLFSGKRIVSAWSMEAGNNTTYVTGQFQ